MLVTYSLDFGPLLLLAVQLPNFGSDDPMDARQQEISQTLRQTSVFKFFFFFSSFPCSVSLFHGVQQAQLSVVMGQVARDFSTTFGCFPPKNVASAVLEAGITKQGTQILPPPCWVPCGTPVTLQDALMSS